MSYAQHTMPLHYHQQYMLMVESIQCLLPVDLLLMHSEVHYPIPPWVATDGVAEVRYLATGGHEHTPLVVVACLPVEARDCPYSIH